MLVKKSDAGFDKKLHVFEPFARRITAEMDDSHRRIKYQATRAAQAQRQIEILEIEKIARIEKSNFLHGAEAKRRQ